MKTKLVTALLLVFLATLHFQISTAFAQGSAFTYQGRLSDGAISANGIFDLRFTIYDAATNGAAQAGPLTNTATSVSNGLFAVTLDFGAVVFSGADRWLEIGARSNGSGSAYQDLSPRQKLTATPYATRAANFSGNVAANQLTGTISSNNIGAGSITTVMLAAGAVGSNQLASGAVTTTALAEGAVTAAKVAQGSNWLALTIANPLPAPGDLFGGSVAALGSDRVLIGAYGDDTVGIDSGTVYLLSTNGALLTTFNNPTPGINDFFGFSITAVGSDRVLIGAFADDLGGSDSGVAYLFRTNSALLTTFTNPTPAVNDSFGFSVAAVGSDRVLIGAYQDSAGASAAGVAYLFSTNGTLFTTITNPTPAANDNFGAALTAVGPDRLLITATHDDTGAINAGAAYLLSTNGTLLTTITNPTPANDDQFGTSVAAMGSDRVLIGVPGDDSGAANVGVAYLFSTNGTLLTTFTNPTPVVSDFFGRAVAALGSDRVLITAIGDDAVGPDTGTAYIFSTNGALLAILPNPTPGPESFGTVATVVGSDRVLVGALNDLLGANGAGAAYLFSLQTFATGLVTEAAAPRSITTISLEDGAVTLAKLDPAIGVWTRVNENVYRPNGNVGIGTATPLERLEVSGMIRSQGYRGRTGTTGSYGLYLYNFEWTGSSLQAWIDDLNVGTVSFTSDRRLKEAIAPLPAEALDRVLALKPSLFRYKDIAGSIFTGDDGVKEGFIADELQAVIPSAVNGTTDAVTERGQIQPQTVNALPLVAVLTKAVQELNEKVETRNQESTDRIQKLETENAELKARLEKLEQRLGAVTNPAP